MAEEGLRRLPFQRSKSNRNAREKKPKKYRVRIHMVKPFEFVDVWGKRPGLDDALEAFSGEILTIDASEYFRVEVSEA